MPHRPAWIPGWKALIVDKGIILQPLDSVENHIKRIVGALQEPRQPSTTAYVS